MSDAGGFGATVHRIPGRADIGHRVKIDLRLVDGVTRPGENDVGHSSRLGRLGS
jgi:hypothetical protein